MQRARMGFNHVLYMYNFSLDATPPFRLSFPLSPLFNPFNLFNLFNLFNPFNPILPFKLYPFNP